MSATPAVEGKPVTYLRLESPVIIIASIPEEYSFFLISSNLSTCIILSSNGVDVLNKRLVVAAADAELKNIDGLMLPVAHLSCSFDSLKDPSGGIKGGILAVGGDMRHALAGTLSDICARHGFTAVMMGFGASPQLETMRICSALRSRGIGVYLTEEAWLAGCGAKAVISSAVTGGSFRLMLEDAVRKFGAENTVLDLERLRHSFSIPCPDGRGTFIDKLPRGDIFMSDELCCKYISRDKGKQFILFDDVSTIRLKGKTAAEYGVCEMIAMYPEWSAQEISEMRS